MGAPLLLYSRFDIFKSRCTIQFACRYATADISCRTILLTSDSENGLDLVSANEAKSCSQYSNTKKTLQKWCMQRLTNRVASNGSLTCHVFAPQLGRGAARSLDASSA
jgi:hypothetical protein